MEQVGWLAAQDDFEMHPARTLPAKEGVALCLLAGHSSPTVRDLGSFHRPQAAPSQPLA